MAASELSVPLPSVEVSYPVSMPFLYNRIPTACAVPSQVKASATHSSSTNEFALATRTTDAVEKARSNLNVFVSGAEFLVAKPSPTPLLISRFTVAEKPVGWQIATPLMGARLLIDALAVTNACSVAPTMLSAAPCGPPTQSVGGSMLVIVPWLRFGERSCTRPPAASFISQQPTRP